MRKVVQPVQSPEPQDSDVRLKQNIDAVGSMAEGLPLYSFRYLWDDTEYVGVMAQDVLEVRPDAVLLGEDGYYRVDYAKLGTRMMTRTEWDALQLEDGQNTATAMSPEPKPESDFRLKREIVLVGQLSLEPPVSDIRLNRVIGRVGIHSPEPKPSDVRLKHSVFRVGTMRLNAG